MNLPIFHNNLLAVYAPLIAHLSQVEGVVKVLEAQDLSDFGETKKRFLANNSVFVFLDAITPQANERGNQTIEIVFSVVLVRQALNPNKSAFKADELGEIYTKLCQVLNGFDPKNEDGKHYLSRPFSLKPPAPIDYRDGFALFPIRVGGLVEIIQQKGN